MTSLSRAKVRKNRQSNSKIDEKCTFLAKFFGFFLCNLVFRAKFAIENKKQTRHGVSRETKNRKTMTTYTLTYAVLENDKVYKFYANDYCVIETLYGLLKNSGLYYGICMHQQDEDGSERTYMLKK